jgi:hypothetical protein
LVSYWRNFGNKRYHKILEKGESTGEHKKCKRKYKVDVRLRGIKIWRGKM